MTENELYLEFYKRFGPVNRAKKCFLYTKKGIRVTDLFQENGRAILGWGGDSAFTHLKNFLNKGITGGFICEEHSKVEKAVSVLLNSKRKVLFYPTKMEALKAGLLFSANKTSVWKPWTQNDIDWEQTDSVVLAPPLPWTDNFYILAINESIWNEKAEIQKLIPLQTKVAYPIQVGIARAIYNMIDALKTRKETDWFIYDKVITKYWQRKGPYLFPKIPQEKYDDFVLHCLDCNLLINPDYNNASIVPFGADFGVFSNLKNHPFEV